MKCVSLVDGGWVFDKNLNKWTSINISIQDGIIVIIALIYYKEFGTETEKGEVQTPFFRIKKCCIV